MDPTLPWAYWELAQALATLKRYPESIEAADNAIRLRPDASAHATKAALLLDGAIYLGAMEAILHALPEGNDSSWILSIKAQICLLAGEFERAAEVADQAIRAQPPEPAAFEIKARSIDWGSHPDAARAVEYFRAAHRLSPDDMLVQTGLATVLFFHGQRDEAITIYETIVSGARESATSAEHLHCVGWAQHQLGRHQPALQLLGESLALDPNSPFARFDFALALLGAGRMQRCKQEYKWGLTVVRKLPLLARRLPLVIALNDLADDGVAPGPSTEGSDAAGPTAGGPIGVAANRVVDTAEVRCWAITLLGKEVEQLKDDLSRSDEFRRFRELMAT